MKSRFITRQLQVLHNCTHRISVYLGLKETQMDKTPSVLMKCLTAQKMRTYFILVVIVIVHKLYKSNLDFLTILLAIAEIFWKKPLFHCFQIYENCYFMCFIFLNIFPLNIMTVSRATLAIDILDSNSKRGKTNFITYVI